MEQVMEFRGPLSELLQNYVAFRQAIGFQMGYSSQLILKKIAECLYRYPLIDDVIDRARAEEISARRPGEADQTRMSRYLVLRQFCLWLRHTGRNAYVPAPGPFKVTSRFIPRIITEKEMASILEAANARGFAWAVMILEILWCTGMRIGEVVRLRIGDFDKRNATLYVAHAKGDRSRLIPASATLADSLIDYLATHRAYAKPKDWIFPGKDPSRHRHRGAVGNRLREIYRSAGVLTREGRPIRTHDIRHSFAVKVLENMVEAGTDVYVALPYLSTFMGHANIFDTEYYLRLLPSHHQDVIDMQTKTSKAVFGVDAL